MSFTDKYDIAVDGLSSEATVRFPTNAIIGKGGKPVNVVLIMRYANPDYNEKMMNNAIEQTAKKNQPAERKKKTSNKKLDDSEMFKIHQEIGIACVLAFFADSVIVDWEGLTIGGEPAPYDAKDMQEILEKMADKKEGDPDELYQMYLMATNKECFRESFLTREDAAEKGK